MAENVVLNPGTGGSILRTLRDAGGLDWPVGVTAYATTISDGANVVQIVDSAHGLPVAIFAPVEVEQATAGDLNATAHQGGTWTVGLSTGTTVGLAAGSSVAVSGTVSATQSGAWSVGVSGDVAVAQSTASNLNATVVQSDAANLKATVTLASGSTVAATQSGSWTVSQGTAANLKTEATLASGSAVALNAGTALIGKASVGQDSAAVYDGTTLLERRFAKIAASSSGDNTIVAAVTDNKIRVLRWGLTANGDVDLKWKSDSTDITGVRPLTKFASAGGAYCPVGVFQTAKGEALKLNLSAAVAVGGELTYVLQPDPGGPDGPGGGTGAD